MRKEDNHAAITPPPFGWGGGRRALSWARVLFSPAGLEGGAECPASAGTHLSCRVCNEARTMTALSFVASPRAHVLISLYSATDLFGMEL